MTEEYKFKLTDFVEQAPADLKAHAEMVIADLTKEMNVVVSIDDVKPLRTPTAVEGFVLADALNGIAKKNLLDLIKNLSDTSRDVEQRKTDLEHAKLLTRHLT